MATTPKSLTKRQTKVLRYILLCYRRGYLPSIREVASVIGSKNPNAAYCHILALQKKGYLMPHEGKAGIRLSRRSVRLIWESMAQPKQQ